MDDNTIKSREAIEETGKLFEKFGLTPMQGRIIACLTVSEPPEKTFDDLVAYFKASKSSVSIALNYLMQIKVIDYKTFASDRKRYFFLTDSFLKVYIRQVLENVSGLREYAYKAVSARTPEYPVANERLLKWVENANRLQESLEDTIDQLESDQ
jgi:DNA-binding transcriptional regulator GbsR (MarR family)